MVLKPYWHARVFSPRTPKCTPNFFCYRNRCLLRVNCHSRFIVKLMIKQSSKIQLVQSWAGSESVFTTSKEGYENLRIKFLEMQSVLTGCLKAHCLQFATDEL